MRGTPAALLPASSTTRRCVCPLRTAELLFLLPSLVTFMIFDPDLVEYKYDASLRHRCGACTHALKISLCLPQVKLSLVNPGMCVETPPDMIIALVALGSPSISHVFAIQFTSTTLELTFTDCSCVPNTALAANYVRPTVAIA